MKEIVTKMIGVAIAFVIMVLGPLCIYTLSSDLYTYRSTANEVSKFLDVATDTGQIDAVALGDFYLACSSYGAICDVTVTRYLKVVNPDKNGTTYVSYTPISIEENMSSGDTKVQLNKGDILQVEVKCIDYPGVKKITSTIFSFMSKKFEIIEAGRVRN